GICCLRPGVEGVSENIRVVSIVGRFLEHSRIFSFARNGDDPVVYIGSADLMPRNLDTRVELDAPVEDEALRDDLLDTLERCLAAARPRAGARRGRRASVSESADARTPREAIADVRIKAPTRGNRKLEALLDAVNEDDQVKAWWHVSAVNATRRLGMSDHSWVHIQIVVNIALRMARLLFRRGVEPGTVADHGMSERDAEVVIAAGALFHCVGMQI